MYKRHIYNVLPERNFIQVIKRSNRYHPFLI